MTQIQKFYNKFYPDAPASEMLAAMERAKSIIRPSAPAQVHTDENIHREVQAAFAAGGMGCRRNNSKYRGVGTCWKAK